MLPRLVYIHAEIVLTSTLTQWQQHETHVEKGAA
jgi:hypothetical protein